MTRRQHGYGGHLAVWRDCLFRLHTSVDDRYRISTVGDWQLVIPGREVERPRPIGAFRIFETMVFTLGADGEPASWNEIDSAGYDSADEAEAGHEAMVRKYEGQP